MKRGVSLFHRLLLGAALVFAICQPALAQRGAYTARRSLEQMVSGADVIVRGSVISARVESIPQYPNLRSVVVTLKLHKVLKGTAGSTYTFRQFIWDARDRYDAAGYRKGQRYLLFMHRANDKGLTSPVGMQQGRFLISRDESGTETAVNGIGNAGLFREVPVRVKQRSARISQQALRVAESHRRGPVRLEELEEIVRVLGEVRQ
ncbi:MAG TPA: hypothetical protein VEB03_01305 [Candidatus Nanoarchaeia archaeon]|nr:hypothetical protein [Candidatus Nanoarchaeia archaeon]